jgi:hypothetical protein
MIDGPSEYSYVRNRPTELRDPTGMFADIDPELPQFDQAFAASTVILMDLSLWKLLGPPPCSISDWSNVNQQLMTAALSGNISIQGDPLVWQWRGGYTPLPAYTIGHTIFLTPAAGYASISSASGAGWAPASVPTAAGFVHIKTWIGLLGHELAHASGAASAQDETLANQIGVFLESLGDPHFLELLPTPFNAGSPPQ